MSKKPSKPLFIKVGARSSLLSQEQIKEVQREIKRYHPSLTFDTHLIETTGDQDLKTSLRLMDKTDFFTKEIDTLLLLGKCDVAIHSAKDLPAPLPKGLALIALTKGINPSDSLVLRPGDTLKNLPKGARIATSSLRREEAVKTLRKDLTFTEVRGPIHKRLQALFSGICDGLVVAEAALIRLRLTHLNRLSLPGPTAPFQGQLAIVAQENNNMVKEMFSFIDIRKCK